MTDDKPNAVAYFDEYRRILRGWIQDCRDGTAVVFIAQTDLTEEEKPLAADAVADSQADPNVRATDAIEAR